MRRRAPRPLAAALAAVMGELEPATPLAAAQAAWGEVVGEVIAAHAAPALARGGVLEVVCDEAVWAAELELMGPELVARLNAVTGGAGIVSLRCRVGS